MLTLAPVSTLADAQSLQAAIGKALFERHWVPAPSSTRANDGLGPLYNARSCAACHSGGGGGYLNIGGDGRLAGVGGVVRMAGPEGEPDPIYSAQVQTAALPGHAPEAIPRIRWIAHIEAFSDGAEVEMRRPEVKLDGLAYGPLAKGTRASLVLAPDLRRSARIAKVDLERVPMPALGGRVSRDDEGRPVVFGRKATGPSLGHQTALAFSRDLGMSSAAFPSPAGDCTPAQRACLAAPHGDETGDGEIAPAVIAALTEYLLTLDRGISEAGDDTRGRQIFESTGCASCHTPQLAGRDGRPIAIYSDLALHDLGPGLAGLSEGPGRAAAAEWRTAPLIGLARALAEGATLLHDGRARSIAEAILWHGGSAQSSRDRYKALTPNDRRTLENFVATR